MTPALKQVERRGTIECRERALRPETEDETERPPKKVELTPALKQAERRGKTECRGKALRLEKEDETERPCQRTGGGNQSWETSPRLRRKKGRERKGG